MKPETFDLLETDTKRLLIMRQGVLLMSRKSGSYRAYLFQLFDFYVELVVSRKTNSLEWVNSFDTLDNLEPYLEMIDISSLTAN